MSSLLDEMRDLSKFHLFTNRSTSELS